ncbi:hypothetical protein AB0I34_09370 [Kribbella sp. NPDC050281]|uniref:hypothetical protein n=1 Tax=Kribbella sp. NPDC050281 TaxID=3155515 RepID=UPI00341042F7
MFTGSSITAEAQPGAAQAALQWTVTPTGRQPANLDDIDSRAGETWAVGGDQIDGFQDQRPLALRWDGKRWKATAQPVRTNATLQSVAVAGAENVWAVGEDRADPATPKPLVMHWNGARWRVVPGPSVPTGSFGSVAIGPNGAVWAAGWANVDGQEHAVVYRYAGGSWQPLTAGLEGSINGNTLAVISAKDAWLGLNGGLAHFDGKRWTLVDDVPADGSQIPTGIAVAGPKNICLSVWSMSPRTVRWSCTTTASPGPGCRPRPDGHSCTTSHCVTTARSRWGSDSRNPATASSRSPTCWSTAVRSSSKHRARAPSTAP